MRIYNNLYHIIKSINQSFNGARKLAPPPAFKSIEKTTLAALAHKFIQKLKLK